MWDGGESAAHPEERRVGMTFAYLASDEPIRRPPRQSRPLRFHPCMTPLASARLLALACLLTGCLAPRLVRAEVVFGNLGSNGTGGLSSSFVEPEPNSLYAVGFNTGNATLLTVTKISVGLFWNNSFTAPASIDLYSDQNGSPHSIIAASGIVNVGGKAVYAFSFSHVQLAPNTSYWIVPDPGLDWYTSAAGTAPTAQNGSGYIGLGTKRGSGSSWSTNSETTLSVSMVPEPGTTGLIVAAAITVALGSLRRRLVT